MCGVLISTIRRVERSTKLNPERYGDGRPRAASGAQRYWLAHITRAIHSTSRTGRLRSPCSALIERKLDRLGGAALELLHHHLALAGLDHHAVAAADRGGGRDQDDGAVAIGRLHRIAGDLERVGVLVVDRRETGSRPSPCRPGSRRRRNSRRRRLRRSRSAAPPWPAAARSRRSAGRRPRRCSRWRPATSATDSVEGQRGRPSGVMRLDLLKVVGSRPAFLARPDAERPARAARRSRAPQICAWVSIADSSPIGHRKARDLIQIIGIVTGSTIRPATYRCGRPGGNRYLRAARAA